MSSWSPARRAAFEASKANGTQRRARTRAYPQPRLRDTGPQMVVYDLPLRPDPWLMVRLVLPEDLTPAEAERLCAIVRAIGLVPAGQGGTIDGVPQE